MSTLKTLDVEPPPASVTSSVTVKFPAVAKVWEGEVPVPVPLSPNCQEYWYGGVPEVAFPMKWIRYPLKRVEGRSPAVDPRSGLMRSYSGRPTTSTPAQSRISGTHVWTPTVGNWRVKLE